MIVNILYIGNKLSKHGITVTSIETLGILLEKEGYNVFYASSKRNKVLRLFEMILKTIQYRHKVDYVLIDTYSTDNFWYAFFVSQLCRILGLKYIPKLHGGDLPKRIQRNPRFSSMIFKNAFRNIAPSSYLLEAFKDKGYTNLLCIPNTIELQNYPFKVRETISPKLLWVRSFSSIYNPEMAIMVLLDLKNEFPEATLCMVGPDKDGTFSRIQAMAKQHNVAVKFTGKLSKSEWVTLSEDYDIFINTTHYDNTPVSVIEAMALGLPVVSTDVGGLSYLLQNKQTAMLVGDSDVAGMANAIREIISDKTLRDQIISNAYNLVREFDWEKVKIKWHEVLK
jgi:glycosyltransferase involved in cell wall biosynthesis